MRRLQPAEACWCGSGSALGRCHGDRRRLRRAPVRPGRVGPARRVPDAIAVPGYVRGERLPVVGVQRPSGPALQRLRTACGVAARVLTAVGAAVEPGITTDELDAIAHAAYIAEGAYPSTLGYRGYPKSICTSVNEVACHGIPDSRRLAEGDIVNIDVTAYVEGMHGDTSATFVVGRAEPAIEALVEATRRAMLAGVAAVTPGRPVRAIAEAVERVASAQGFGVVSEYGGHGIGAAFHAPPHIGHSLEHYERVAIEPGMTFTIEPMLTAGSPRLRRWEDGWTVVTEDLLPSAQFEHTVIAGEGGVEVLTLTESGESPAGAPRAPGRPGGGS